MDTFFNILRKGLVGTLLLIFAFVITYVPQPYNHIERAEAIVSIGGATEVTQMLNNVELSVATFAETTQLVIAENSWFKEYILDGIAWTIAKNLVSMMVRSLINWINSGFKGSPAFIQDLDGFLMEVGDRAAGEFISGLGKAGSFICSPFKLDIQLALSLDYKRTREGRPQCKLSDIVGNLEDFISGNFSEGGWENWFTIVNDPDQYTPLGQLQTAKSDFQARLVNSKGVALEEVKWGDGFLSSKICEKIEGPTGPKEKCVITKPGKTVQEALSFNLDSGRQSLISADEFNEIIGSLISQLANKALTGTAGLLGLSSGTGHTYEGYGGGSYLDAMVASSSDQISTGSGLALINEALTVQRDFNALATSYLPRFTAYANNTLNDPDQRLRAEDAYDEAIIIRDKTVQNTSLLNSLVTEYNALEDEYARASLSRQTQIRDRQSEIVTSFLRLDVYTRQDLESKKIRWESVISQ